MGGGFGPKASFYSEEVLVPWLARHLRRPVKWIEDRWEHFVSAAQEREQVHTVEIAFTAEGRLVALRDVFVHDQGAYANNGLQVPNISGTTVPGPYKIPNLHIEYRAVYTTMPPVTAVRGAGRPQGVWVMERMMDRIAAHLGLDPAEVALAQSDPGRRVPLPGRARLPRRQPSHLRQRQLPRAAAPGPRPHWLPRAARRAGGAAGRGAAARHRARRRTSRAWGSGRSRARSCGSTADGRIIVTLGAPPQGQGYQTVFAQVCADALGARFEDIDVVTGDTGKIPFGVGTFASRVMANAGPSVFQAGPALREKILAVAGHLLEAAPADLAIDGRGRLRARRSRSPRRPRRDRPSRQRRRPRRQHAPGRAGRPGGSAYFAPERGGYASGVHVCAVDVDPETGRVEIVHYLVGHDCGTVVNPLLVEGQVFGGVAHGISNTLFEEALYDDAGPAHGHELS